MKKLNRQIAAAIRILELDGQHDVTEAQALEFLTQARSAMASLEAITEILGWADEGDLEYEEAISQIGKVVDGSSPLLSNDPALRDR